jgi:hypothetical protein
VPPAATGAYGSATIGGAGISVANIVLVIMAGLLVVGVLFAKWSTSPLLADYGSWFGAGATSFTLFGEFDLVNQMTDLMGTAGSLASSFGVSADVFDAFSLVKVVLFLVVAAVVVACLLLVIGGVFLFMRKTTAHIFCALGALALFVITGLHSLILMFANASIADELASASWGLLGDVSIIAPTGLIWLLTLLAIGTAVFAFLQMGKSKA